MWSQHFSLQKTMLNASAFLFVTGLCLFAFTGSVLFIVPAFVVLYLLLLIFDFKAAYWILLILVPLSVHLEFADNSFSLSAPSEPVMWLFYILAGLMLIADSKLLPKWFLQNTITVIILMQFIWLIVAVCYSEVVALSVKYLIAKSWYLVCFFLIPVWLVKEKTDFKKLFLCLLIPLVLYIFIILIRHSFYGFQFYYIDAAVGNLFYKHVDYASVLSMFIPFVFAAYFIHRKINKKYRNYFILLSLLFLLAIGFSYTRAAMGGIVFAIGVALAIRWRLVNWVIPGFYAVVLALFLFFTSDNKFLKYHPHFSETYMHHEFGDHLKATLEGKDMSSVERVYRWIAAVRMGIDRPLTGFGPHSFYYYYKPYTLSAYRTYVSENYERSTTHNYFLYMLVEQGIPAMLLYALLVIVVLAKTQKIYHRLQDSFYKWICLAIAMSFSICFVNNLFSELIETDKVGPLFYLSLAALVIIDRKSKEIPVTSFN